MESRFDAVVKDLFQKDRPSLLTHISGGVPLREFLNVEIPKILERRVDLVARLADESILHVEGQSANDPEMQFRMGIYHVLLLQRYRCDLRHVVLYLGEARMSMREELQSNRMQFGYELMDIREVEAGTLLQTERPADIVLAMLARGGEKNLGEVVRRLARLRGAARHRALVQLSLLAGLRSLTDKLQLELQGIGMLIDISKNVIWQQFRSDAIAEGLSKGLSQGLSEGMLRLFRGQLEAKFGKIPVWAEQRLAKAKPTQIERWAKKLIHAEKIEQVLGPKVKALARR